MERCRNCNGTGYILVPNVHWGPGVGSEKVLCPKCGGKGGFNTPDETIDQFTQGYWAIRALAVIVGLWMIYNGFNHLSEGDGATPFLIGGGLIASAIIPSLAGILLLLTGIICFVMVIYYGYQEIPVNNPSIWEAYFYGVGEHMGLMLASASAACIGALMFIVSKMMRRP
jgi:hypothetical protein